MLTACPPKTLGAMKIREKISDADRGASRRDEAGQGIAPSGAFDSRHAAKYGARRAAWLARGGHMWRAAGDTSVDYNYYTKRSLLAGIYAATLLVFMNDESDNHAETSAFLARGSTG
jgi:ubiquinone biosynthesis protein COQ9